nr:uncharacterized protein LOC113700774 [Coffea arabica]
MPAIVIWFLWKVRNRARHEGVPFQSRQVILDIESFVVQLGQAGVLMPKHFIRDLEHPWAPTKGIRSKRFKVCAVAWSRPPLNMLKLNTDASVFGARASGGGLVRDHTGHLIFAFYKEFGEVDTLTAEGLSLWHALLYCKERNLTGLLAEVDSEVLVHFLLFSDTSKWPLCYTLHRIQSLLVELSSTVRHIFREANSCADKLAGGKHPTDTVFSSVHQLPPTVRATLQLDRWEVPFTRSWVVK